MDPTAAAARACERPARAAPPLTAAAAAPRATPVAGRAPAAWDPASAQHTLRYSDGERGAVWAGAERLRLALAAGEALAPPGPDELRRLAASYWRWAAALDAWRAGRRGGGGGASGGEGGGGGGAADAEEFAQPGSDAWVSGGGAGRRRGSARPWRRADLVT
jgi:hypothetical protein